MMTAAMRASLLNARLPLLMDLAPDDPSQVRAALDLLEKPRLRTSLRLLVSVLHFLIAASCAWIAARLFPGVLPDTVWVPLIGALVSALLIIFLEYLVEGFVLKRAEVWELRFSRIVFWLDRLLSPLSGPLLSLLGNVGSTSHRLSPVTEFELRNWVEEGQQEGGLEKGEREMIYSIFQFGDRLAREIMVPRIDVVGAEIQSTVAEAAGLLADTGHSRIPVYEDSIDNIIGLLYAKDLLRSALIHHGNNGGSQSLADLRELLREAYFVPEAKKVDELLQEMQEKRIHMAIIVDEYGGVAGIVTLEDIMEEIVGEIQDEYDLAEENPYTRHEDGSVVFRGSIDLDDFNEVMDSHIDKDYADTLGGLMFTLFGRVPENGESLMVDGLNLKVEQVSGRRIRQVRASRVPDMPSEARQEEHGRRGLFGRRTEETTEEDGSAKGEGENDETPSQG